MREIDELRIKWQEWKAVVVAEEMSGNTKKLAYAKGALFMAETALHIRKRPSNTARQIDVSTTKCAKCGCSLPDTICSDCVNSSPSHY